MSTTGRKRLGEILVQAGVLAEAQLRAALTEQRRWGGPLGRILVDMKLITEESMVQALSHQLNLPAVNLDQRTIPSEVLDLLPGDQAEQLSVVPFNVQGKFLDLAMVDPTNIGAIDALRTRTRLNVRPYLAGPKAIERALARHYGRGVSSVELHTGGTTLNNGAIEMPANLRQVTVSPGLSDSQVTAPVAPSTGVRRNELAEAAAREAEQIRTLVDLRGRVEHLEALVARDEDVLRKLLAIIVEKGIATREELLERMR